MTALLIRTQRKPGWLPRAWEILITISVYLLQMVVEQTRQEIYLPGTNSA
ncbi:hypothetical protein N8667_00115 [Verrucomicrobia bacterium]|nr:hypothetical protein [Verrucomicrobiota bacterium]